jgi:3,4-dihydroxyphenylacetate 2,3-dioxygenase
MRSLFRAAGRAAVSLANPHFGEKRDGQAGTRGQDHARSIAVLSEQPGKHHGCRQAAIDGHVEIGRRCRALGVDSIVVFDVHWLVNAGYHVLNAPSFSGTYTSNELPHFIRNMEYAYPGNPALGRLIAETATAHGVFTRAHEATTLELEYGTLVPMRYMNRTGISRWFRSPRGVHGTGWKTA